MRKKKKHLKEYIVDYIVCFTATLLTIVIFSFYFYNVFVKFQINYANLYNDNILTKSLKLHDDIITVSDSFFTNLDINTFISDPEAMTNLQISNDIKKYIDTSTIAPLVSEVTISVPRHSLAYSTRFRQKFTFDELIKKSPRYKETLDVSTKNMQIFSVEGNIAHCYRNYKGYSVCVFLKKSDYKNYLMEHVYPIFYGAILLNSKNEPVVTNKFNDPSQIVSALEKNKNVTTKGNYLIIKNTNSLYSAVSVIKISDIFKNALSTSSFLIIVLTLLLMLLAIITYYFYFKHKKLILNHTTLKNTNMDANINNIMYKLFSRDIITAQDESILNEYFSLNEGSYFLAVILIIKDYSDFTDGISYDDVTMYKYGFENIINEAMQEIVATKTVNMGKDLIGVLLYNDSPIDIEAVKIKLKYAVDMIKNNFQTELFTVIGEETEEIMNVYEQIPRMIAAQSYKFIKNDTEIQLSNIPESISDITYPTFIQNEILMHINSHNKESFKYSLEKFAKYIIDNEYLGGKEWFLKLFLFISENCKSSPDISIKYNTLENMLTCEKITEMTDMLADSIEYLNNTSAYEYIENKNDFPNTVKRIIEEEFSNPDFCIQNIIDRFGITASYFGKKFKHHFNMSFNRYLLECRLNHAIKLLMETDFTNEKIASMCGFNSRTYFMTIFKKTTGMSPKEYKNNTNNLQ